MYCGTAYAANSTYPRGWTTCTSTTGTATDYFWFDYPLTVTRVSAWTAPIFTVPKWWRWFDVFRTWAKPKLLPLLEGYRQAVRRVQERYPAQQRARRKRRAYVQALHAL